MFAAEGRLERLSYIWNESLIRREQEWKDVSGEVSCTLYFLIFLGIFSGGRLTVSFSLRFCFLPYFRAHASLLYRLFLWLLGVVLVLYRRTPFLDRLMVAMDNVSYT